MSEVTFTRAVRDFFGMRPNQTLTEFAAELKELTSADRVELATDLAKHFKEDIEVTLSDQIGTRVEVVKV